MARGRFVPIDSRGLGCDRRTVEELAAARGRSLPTADRQRYGQYVQGFRDVNGLRDRLDTIADHLREFAPTVDERYTNPEFETDWHDVLLDLGISALTSGVTSTLTIGSGRGEIFGAWKGWKYQFPHRNSLSEIQAAIAGHRVIKITRAPHTDRNR